MQVVGGASVDDGQLSALQLQLDESHGQQIVELKQQLQVSVRHQMSCISTRAAEGQCYSPIFSSINRNSVIFAVNLARRKICTKA